MAFPEGLPPTTIPVHPTQLYEAAALVPLAFLLLYARRAGYADSRVLGLYLVLAGAIRFAIEFIRIDVRVLGILSVAHLAALIAVAAGLILLVAAPARKTPQ